MNPFSSGTRLRDMIRAIRASKTAAEERAVVRKECAAIRAAISDNDHDYRHRNLAKLMFIHMLGYPTHFGQMECLKLIASPGFPEKRIGYLGLMLLLDERQEVLMLVTNSIKQDLNHTNQYIVGLALCALGNIGSAEMARDLAPEVERLLKFRDPNIRKKAALCSIRIIKKVPDLAENFIHAAASLLSEKHHGVLITGVQLCIDLCKISTEALEHFRKKCTDGLVKLMRDLANSPYAPEYDISGITDPFLQIRLLRLLRSLGKDDADASDTMNDILAQVATKTESNKNAGNAILYECVAAIMSVEDNGGLRVLAINILGRFLSNRDNNIRYVALNMLMKALAVDSQAVQRHRTTILECVKDSDPSIRKRAVELVYLLVNESNVKPMTKELIEYLEASDPEFRGDLTAKICSIVEKFSPEKIWYIDQMLKVLSEAGNDVKDEAWHSLIVVITNASNLHGYAVRSLYRSVQAAGEQETLVRVAIWCIGEYGDMLVNNAGRLDIEEPLTVTESDAVDVLETSFKSHSFDLTTRAMCLIALLKLSSRFPTCSQRINDIIVQYKGSFVLELQQRAIEFNSIIARHQNIRPSLVERMPVLDEATHSGRKAGSVPAAVSTSQGVSVNLPNGVAKPSAAPLVDLLDLSSDDVPAPSSSGGDFLQDLLGVDLVPVSSQSGTNQAQVSGTNVLLDLLSIGTPSANSSPSTIQASPSNVDTKSPMDLLDRLSSPSAPSVQVSTTAGSSPMLDLLNGFPSSSPIAEGNGLAYPSIVAFESSSLKLTFNFSKQPENPQTTLIEASFTNKSGEVLTNFIFQAAVPKFLQLHLDPASGNMLPANSSGSIMQKLKLTNSQHGKKSLVMRIRIAYKVNNKDVLEEGQVNNFPLYMLLASPLCWRLFTQSIRRPPPPCKHFSILRRCFSSTPPMGKTAKSCEANSSASIPKDETYLENVIPKRIALFESIQNQQRLQRLALSPDPIKIELVDGTIKEGKKWNTTPLDIAKEISKSLAANALIAKVNGVLWDLSRPLEGDCKLEIFKFETDEGRDTFWHSSAHILGESLERTFGCKLCIGPCTTRGEGFYYDAFYGDLGLNEDHFQRIKEEATKAVSEKQPFERIEVSRQQALDMFSDNRFKVEIIKDLPEDKTITVYRCGPLVDLCRGPHIPNTSFVKALACTKASSAYWRGDKDRESLQRVYGISFPDQKQLKVYLDMLAEAKKYDHRELTKKQELFFFHPLSPGSCFFLPHGARICNKLLEFIKSQYWKRGYKEVWSPNMYNMQLWETSGHAANYKENMFVFEIEKQEFGLKPMNCPGHCLIFDHRVRSYRELPLRLADFGVLHRNEASGALTGLTRVRRFQQDDAHIFCRESQIKEEVKGVLDFISYVYEIFGFTFNLKLSTRPEKYLGDLESWEKAEAALAEALNEFGKPWEINEGDGAFYGPKIDITVSDAMKRKFQCATLQLDFQLPQRFNLSYSAEDESKRERPVMIHRAILGSVERMFAILLEHFKGKWPFWLSPRQAMVCPVSDKSLSYAFELRERIHDAGYYVDVDTSDRTIQKKVREAQMAQYNYILVVGEAEASSGQVSVRVRSKSDHEVMTVDGLLTHFKDLVASFQ